MLHRRLAPATCTGDFKIDGSSSSLVVAPPKPVRGGGGEGGGGATDAQSKTDRDHRPSSSTLNNKGIVPSTKLQRNGVPVLSFRQHQDSAETAQDVWTINKSEVVTYTGMTRTANNDE